MNAARRYRLVTAISLLTPALLILLSVGAARAQLLVYDFSNFDVTPTFEAPGISGGDFARDGNFNGTTFNTAVVNGSIGSPAPAVSSPGWAAATLSPDLYYTFTLTPSGASALVSGLFFDAQSPTAGNGGPTGFSVRSSLDGFTANLSTGTLTTGFVRKIIPLTTLAPAGQDLEFRIYGFGGNDSGAILNVDNVTVVPEPAVAHTLLAAGLTLLIGWHRRRRRSPSPVRA